MSSIEVEGVADTQACLIPHPIHQIAARRSKAGKFVAGPAASCSSDTFKGESTGKPNARRWDHLLSVESKLRQQSSLKGAAKYLKQPGLISLGGGLPSSDYFPIAQVDITVPTVPYFSPQETEESGLILRAGRHDAAEDRSAYDLSIALQYGLGTGSAQLIRFVTEHTEIVSDPPYADWNCALTVGSTSATEQAYRMFCERGDYIMAEEYTFVSAVETAIPLGLRVVGIKMDDQGLLPEAMDEILRTWDTEARGARKPHLLYTVPTGQNPTGATQGAERRRALYRVAQKHDVYILEDEPYYFLQMQPYTGVNSPSIPAPQDNAAFLKALVPTLLSIDVDGRVMRMDSFSKVIAPGMRVGWITASAQIVERFIRHNECSNQNPSGLSQIALFKLLDESWGHDGYLKWLVHLRMEYTARRDTILGACERYLPRDIVTWNPPAAGMFLFLKVDWQKHRHADSKGLLALEEEIFLASVRDGVLVSKGSWFIAEQGGDDSVPTDMFFRATFAAASPEKMIEAIERLGAAIRTSFDWSESSEAG